MDLNQVLILLGIGLLAGFFSGLVGIGGGIVVVPLLVFFFGYSMHLAQGTTLFMFLFPIGILGVINYYKAGMVNWKVALIMACAFFFGSYLGSKTALALDQVLVKRIFGVVILLVSIKMILNK